MNGRLGVSLHAAGVRRGGKWVLQNISLRLKPGERWALTGGNGAGKTQLLKLIGTDVWPTPTGRETRIYRVGRRRVDLIEAKRRVAYIGAELQDKYARYDWNLAVSDLLATGLHRTELLLQPVTKDEGRQVAAMLELCGLTALAGRKFLSLSYGQKRLALLARALIQAPDWLLLDEFYNGLDADYRRRIDGVLAHTSANGQGWIASAHRAVDVPRGTQGLMEMRIGRLRTVRRLHRADLDRLAAQASEKATPRGASRSVKKAAAAASAAAVVRAAATQPAQGKLLVRIAGADLYVDYRAVLRGLNWELHAGEHWAVFGANGAGKSSFLKYCMATCRRLWVEASSAPGLRAARPSRRGNARWAMSRRSCKRTMR